MSRFNFNQAEQMQKETSSNYLQFFSLKNDKDSAKVRFLYNGENDIEGYLVHEVSKISQNGKPYNTYVNCLRDYNGNINDCPMCASGSKQVAKYFVPVYDIEEKVVKIWIRGRNFGGELQNICARYSNSSTPLCSQVFEIVRNGAAGSTSTTYGIYPIGQPDGTTLAEYPQFNIIGDKVQEMSVQEMNTYLTGGNVNNSNNNTQNYTNIQRRTPSNVSNNANINNDFMRVEPGSDGVLPF